MKRQLQKIALTLVLLAALANPARADDPTLKDYLGYAKSIYNAVSSFIGTTTVTPRYAVNDWRRDMNQGGTEFHWKYNRDPITGLGTYSYRGQYGSGAWYSDTLPFPLGGVHRLDYYCSQTFVRPDGSTYTLTASEIREFHLIAWADKVTKTGNFPPAQPYPACLKSSLTPLASDCGPASGYLTETRKTFTINDSGGTIVTMGLVDYAYAWPMLCWVGGQYDY